jgi:imidazolonepropionase-like amidohydrolase
MGPDWDRHWHTFLLQDELEGLFDICRLRGKKVMSHAANPDAVKDAVRYGTWTVEHGYIMDDECVQLMKERGTFYVPTLGVSHLTPKLVTNEFERKYLERKQNPPEMVVRADAATEEHGKWFRKALASGVKMAAGSDMGPVKDAVHLEMGLWVRAGATPMQAIKAATSVSAEVCEMGDKLGTVEVGKVADLIVVGANPLDDITNTRKLQMVFQDGKLVVDKTERL